MVRTGVREELVPLEQKLDRRFAEFAEEMDEKLDHTFRKYRDEVLTGLDQVMGELQEIRQEITVLSGQHERVMDLEERVENLEARYTPDPSAPA